MHIHIFPLFEGKSSGNRLSFNLMEISAVTVNKQFMSQAYG